MTLLFKAVLLIKLQSEIPVLAPLTAITSPMPSVKPESLKEALSPLITNNTPL